MSYKFVFEFCNNQGNPGDLSRDDQASASAMFQSYKKQMKAKNDDNTEDAVEDDHMIMVGVTDDLGKPMDTYRHNCVHTRG